MRRAAFAVVAGLLLVALVAPVVSATATVHFASGDVTVDLNRHGKSFVAGGKVPVPADQLPGPVAVDVTITYGGVPSAVPTFNAKIEAGD